MGIPTVNRQTAMTENITFSQKCVYMRMVQISFSDLYATCELKPTTYGTPDQTLSGTIHLLQVNLHVAPKLYISSIFRCKHPRNF